MNKIKKKKKKIRIFPNNTLLLSAYRSYCLSVYAFLLLWGFKWSCEIISKQKTSLTISKINQPEWVLESYSQGIYIAYIVFFLLFIYFLIIFYFLFIVIINFTLPPLMLSNGTCWLEVYVSTNNINIGRN